MIHDLEILPVQNIDEHFSSLYKILLERKYTISHKNIPSMDEHIHFVMNNPYRFWCLVTFRTECIGSIYLQYDNSIGINFNLQYYEMISPVLDLLLKDWHPLKSIPSLRSEKFFVNIPSDDTRLTDVIKQRGAHHIQSSFILD